MLSKRQLEKVSRRINNMHESLYWLDKEGISTNEIQWRLYELHNQIKSIMQEKTRGVKQ